MLVEAAVKNGRLELSGRVVPLGCRSGLALLLVSRPRCHSGATAPNPAHAHGDRDAHACGSRGTRALLGAHDDARASDAWSERGGDRRTGHGKWTQRRKGRFCIQKKPGVQRRQASRFLAHCLTWRQEAANHHEFRLFDQSMPVPARRQAPAAERFARTPRKRASVSCRAARSSHRVTIGYVREVLSSVPEAVLFRALVQLFGGLPAPRGRPRRDVHFTHRRRRALPPIRRPIRTTRPRGDLTVTTRPGVVAFHRSRFARLASPCSGGGAPFGAVDGANFNREVQT